MNSKESESESFLVVFDSVTPGTIQSMEDELIWFPNT